MSTVAFGPFRLNPARRLLEKSGVPVPLSSRAFDILVVLASAHDRVLSRAEIIAQVWPDVIVDEHNLSVQISALRRALGDSGDDPKVIATVPGRGYRFVGVLAEPAPAGVLELPDDTPSPAMAIGEVPPVAAPLARRRWSGRPMAIGAACALVLAFCLPWMVQGLRGPPVNAPLLSIAVLPFRNLDDAGVQPHLAEVVSDDLTTNLSHIPGSLVIASETADSYRSRTLPAPEIGRRLHVRYVVDGSIRVDGDALKVNAQLIDTASGADVWARRYETTVGDLAQTQADITRRIASALDAKLLEVEAARSTERAIGDPGVLDLFVQARDTFERHDTLQGLERAQRLLERALDRKPDDAAILGQLCLVLERKLHGFDDPQDSGDTQELRRVVQHALQLDARNVGALVAHGRMLTDRGRYEEARSNLQTALQADPNNVLALAGLAFVDWKAGDPKAAIAPLRTALRVDPESGQNRNRLYLLGMATFMAGDPEGAVPSLRLAIAGDPDGGETDGNLGRSEFSNLFLIAAQWVRGNKAEAQGLLGAYVKRWPRRSAWRLSVYFTPEQRALPQFGVFTRALVGAGLPACIDENADYGVAAPDSVVSGGDFDATPTAWPGGKAMSAMAVAQGVSLGALVVDVGSGLSTVPNAIVPARLDPEGDPVEVAARALAQHARTGADPPVIVMGDGVTGWQSYNAALQLSARGYRTAWFRGGEEVWANAGRKLADAHLAGGQVP